MQAFNNVRAWERDSDVDKCHKCRLSFGFWNWKHHCRACGRIMCDVCSCHYVIVPYDELCPNAPTSINLKEPQRACWDCAERIRARQRGQTDQVVAQYRTIQAANNHASANIQTVNTLEFDSSKPVKLYRIRIPLGTPLQNNQVLRVDLGGRICHVRVPSNVRLGDELFIRANDTRITTHESAVVITEVYIIDVSTLNDMIHEQTTASSRTNQTGTVARPPRQQQPQQVQQGEQGEENEEVPEDEFIECKACTYHNRLQATNCRLCEAALYE